MILSTILEKLCKMSFDISVGIQVKKKQVCVPDQFLYGKSSGNISLNIRLANQYQCWDLL